MKAATLHLSLLGLLYVGVLLFLYYCLLSTGFVFSSLIVGTGAGPSTAKLPLSCMLQHSYEFHKVGYGASCHHRSLTTYADYSDPPLVWDGCVRGHLLLKLPGKSGVVSQ